MCVCTENASTILRHGKGRGRVSKKQKACQSKLNIGAYNDASALNPRNILQQKLEKQSSKYKADMYAAHTKQHKAEAELLQIVSCYSQDAVKIVIQLTSLLAHRVGKIQVGLSKQGKA